VLQIQDIWQSSGTISSFTVLPPLNSAFLYAMQNTRGAGVEQRVLEALLAKRLPKVAGHLAAAETPASELSAAWFHSLFAAALPAETAARVWDVLLLEGPKILFRVALALFKVPI
jgi:hypothetical protein